jgi:hypothetical protein
MRIYDGLTWEVAYIGTKVTTTAKCKIKLELGRVL